MSGTVTAPGTHPPGRPLLLVENLRVRYANGALGVLDVSLQVARGSITALLGPNGSGKTTTVRACSGFMAAEGAKIVAGNVVHDGRDVTNNAAHVMAKRGVAFVPERDKVFRNMTVRDNLRVAGGARQGRGEKESARSRALELFPELGTRLRDVAGNLSGGQQQMLAIARGLLREPSLLIIDEMTLGLHASLTAPLYRALRVIADQGTTVLLVDESPQEAADIADQIYALEDGTVAFSGAPEHLTRAQLEETR